MTDDDMTRVREYYDAFGEAEWHRLTVDVPGRVSFEVHRRFLGQHVTAGQRVLEIGAGPGRFTAELAALGARVVATDVSQVQLALNAQMGAEHGWDAAVERRELVDVRDVSAFSDGEFDAVVAFGGPLSYAFEQVDDAMRGLFRIVKPGGLVVASVMSTLGAWRHFLPATLEIAEDKGDDVNDAIVQTGDLRPLENAHICQMFRWSEVDALVARCGGAIVAASASNWASLGDAATLEALEQNPARWARFLDNEVGACAEPGVLGGGTHILFAAAAV